jgi:2'-5' RNA ligase
VPLIGVAVAIPDPWGAELESWRDSFGDPLAGSIPAHVTVLPPTEVDDTDLAAVEAHLSAAAASVDPFLVELRGTATFRPVSPVVFVALVSGIAGCEALEAAVRRGPLDRELEHPYHPHVTVAHHLPDDVLDRAFDDLAGFTARFEVRDIVLYVHGAAGWTPVRSFPLAR